MIVLTLYSRPECHLCEELVADAEPLIAGRARIEVVDISEDENLSRKYGLMIPLLMHEDEELSRYRLDRSRLTEFIDRQLP
jgi:hypothetical protein